MKVKWEYLHAGFVENVKLGECSLSNEPILIFMSWCNLFPWVCVRLTAAARDDITNSNATPETEAIKHLCLLLCACSLVVWQLTLKAARCQIMHNPVKKAHMPSGERRSWANNQEGNSLANTVNWGWKQILPHQAFYVTIAPAQLVRNLVRSLQKETPGKALSRSPTLWNRETQMHAHVKQRLHLDINCCITFIHGHFQVRKCSVSPIKSNTLLSYQF